MLKWIAGYFRRARLERELSQLDDRLLADIGITRTQIHALALASANVNEPQSARRLTSRFDGQALPAA